MLAVLSALASAPGSAVAQDAMDGMSMGGRDPVVVHDPQIFEKKLLPVLVQQCLGCHDAADPQNKTRNRMTAPGADGAFTPDAVRLNYENARALANAATPERSLLLAKLIPVSRGGIDHDGGKADGNELPAHLVKPDGALVQWLFGATPSDTPPVAAWIAPPRNVPVGEAVKLDATTSSDPDGKPVTVTWEIADAPQGARAKVADAQSKTTTITPDREGPWVLRLRVSDGKLKSWPALVRFSAVRKADEPRTAPTAGDPSAKLDTQTRRLTRSLFLDLWGRTPTPEELARYAALPWEQRVDALLATDATWQNWLDEEAFYFLLIDQFRPVSDRLVAIPAGMREGRVSFREAHQAFALSAEFNARNPGNDTYCTVVFEQFLGMEVQKAPNVKVLETAKKIYDGKQDRIFNVLARNQSDIVQVTLDQKAYVDLFCRRMERRYLGAALPAAEHDAAVSILATQPQQFGAILREWLLSERYTSQARAPRSKSDPQFIRSLFVDLVGRAPAYEEFRNMRNALQALADPTPLRGVLAKVLLDSQSAIPPSAAGVKEVYANDQVRGEVVDLFRRFLGRDPSLDELNAFAATVQEPGATWRTGALAILTSSQYQLY